MKTLDEIRAEKERINKASRDEEHTRISKNNAIMNTGNEEERSRSSMMADIDKELEELDRLFED